MSEWKCLTADEERIAREKGEDPAALVVNRVGVDLLVFLNMKTRREIIVPLYKETKPTTEKGTRNHAR